METVYAIVGVAGFLLALYHSKRFWDMREKLAEVERVFTRK